MLDFLLPFYSWIKAFHIISLHIHNNVCLCLMLCVLSTYYSSKIVIQALYGYSTYVFRRVNGQNYEKTVKHAISPRGRNIKIDVTYFCHNPS